MFYYFIQSLSTGIAMLFFLGPHDSCQEPNVHWLPIEQQIWKDHHHVRTASNSSSGWDCFHVVN